LDAKHAQIILLAILAKYLTLPESELIALALMVIIMMGLINVNNV
jgi:hypothetical protein